MFDFPSQSTFLLCLDLKLCSVQGCLSAEVAAKEQGRHDGGCAQGFGVTVYLRIPQPPYSLSCGVPREGPRAVISCGEGGAVRNS